MELEPEFEAMRDRLTMVAFRLLGSVHDAEDVVQKTWIKAASAAADAEVRNTEAWLTTIATRICLDDLRSRDRRDALAATAEPSSASVQADEAYLQREKLSRALMVVLSELTPSQRVAYVLHDLFGTPFHEVGTIMKTSADSAKKHASRARRRVQGACPPDQADDQAQRLADAFIDAAAGGDITMMISLMTDDCVRVVDPRLVPAGVDTEVRGAHRVAHETAAFVDRIRATTRVVIDGEPTYVIAPGGHLLAYLAIETRGGRICRIAITPAAS